MWLRRPQMKQILNLQKSLKAFLSSSGPIPKPNLSYPGGSNKVGAYGYFLLVSVNLMSIKSLDSIQKSCSIVFVFIMSHTCFIGILKKKKKIATACCASVTKSNI